MLFHRNKSYFIILFALLFNGCGGLVLQPSHYGKYVFQGTVRDIQGNPIPNAWVKVRGWETLTDSNGKWQQTQVVHCGATRDSAGKFDELDAILITASGYESLEEKFSVKHAAWFSSCETDQVVAFESVLQSESKEKSEAREATKFKPHEYSVVPWPDAKKKPLIKKPNLQKPKGTHL